MCGVRSRAEGVVRRVCRRQAVAARARLRRPVALLGGHDGRAGDRSRDRRSASITFWSTSTRTRIACRRESCAASSRTVFGVTVVGDDAQAIYSFRAATVRNILDFPSQFDPPARIVTLERNYRSTRPILDASNAVIGLASERFTKNLRTERVAGERPALVSVRDEADQARWWPSGCSRSARTRSRSRTRPSCSARPVTARNSSSSSHAATFPT